MKLLLIAALICACSQSAGAQTSECSTVPKDRDRLACYDRAMPPRAAKAVAPQKKDSVSNTSPDQRKTVDALAVENSKLNAKLKTICRGC